MRLTHWTHVEAAAALIVGHSSGAQVVQTGSHLNRLQPWATAFLDEDLPDTPMGTPADSLRQLASRPATKWPKFTLDSYDVLDARVPAGGVRHPFWHFEGRQLARYQVYICCVVLFVAGVLCSAGGIGGGGIYVTVLMVAGSMKVTDAVPLSKSVVFFGSISSLVLNLRKTTSSGGGSQLAKSLIDYNICRLVVPGSLLGTFLGVFLNRHLPSWIILLVLVVVLLFISSSVMSKTWRQYQEENAATVVSANGGVQAGEEASAALPNSKNSHGRFRSTMTVGDVVISIFMLVVVIVFGMLRFHAGQCQRAPPEQQAEACNHPAFFWLGNGTMHKLVTSAPQFVRGFCFVFPLLVCASVLSYYTSLLVAFEGWNLGETLNYSTMAICTGCLAGLVGIGGGLIFSPFFLIMGVDPPVAVASSSTCVIFTSSSTTMQYLLTDRIIISLTIVYGFINLVASYVGAPRS
mmetsp:Transcript_46071/g.106374  ORF Transcript_46071/g.106374 Transcript_46071/m.106374 type:complete len:463 (+) Transcript_46071:45-1433(+)